MPTFIGLRKHLVTGKLNEYQFLCFSLVSQRHTPAASQCITVQLPISKKMCESCIAAIAGYIFHNAFLCGSGEGGGGAGG